jgi:hypothetical protein
MNQRWQGLARISKFGGLSMAIALSTGLLAEACGSSSSTGGGGGSSGASFSTSVPSSTSLSSLSSAQVQALCSDLANFENNLLQNSQDGLCKITGLISAGFANPQTDADARTACQAGYDACKMADAGGGSNGGGVNVMDCTSNTAPANCTATVGDVTACENASASQLSTELSQVPSCSTLTLAQLNGQSGSPAGDGGEPPACTTLDNKCPTL